MQTLLGRARESVAAFGGSFRNPGLRRLALALAGSEIGSWGYWIALSVLAFEAGGAKALGALTVVLMLVPAVAAPFTSILGDRHDRVRVMVGADLIRVALMVLATLIAFAGWPTALLYVVAGLSGIVSTAFQPAQAALLPSVARTPEELTSANVAASTIESVTAFAGPAIGGVIVAVADPGVSFAIAAATFLWSALLVARVRPAARLPGEASVEEERDEEGAERITALVAAGARAIVSGSKVRVLVSLFSAQTVVSGALLVLLPLIALDLLDTGPGGLGALEAALGIGGLLGAGAAIALVGRRRLSLPFGAGTLVWGAPIALVAVWDTPAAAILLLGIVGLANTIVDVAGYTMLQRAVPDAVLARVFGILDSVMFVSSAIGGAAASALAAAFGIETALIAVGAFLPAVVLLSWSRIVRIDAEAPVAVRALELLRDVPFLRPLAPAVLEGLAARAIDVHVPAGGIVIRQGDHGDRFYVVGSGEAGVDVDGEARPAVGAGGWFGEIALLRDVPRTATVTALSDLELVALERDDFIAAVTGHAPSAEAAGAVIESRLRRPGLSPGS